MRSTDDVAGSVSAAANRNVCAEATPASGTHAWTVRLSGSAAHPACVRLGAGKEFRCRGTAAASATVTVRDADRQTVVGTAVAATSGAWEVRLKPGPAAQVGNVLVQSSTGGEARSTVANG